MHISRIEPLDDFLLASQDYATLLQQTKLVMKFLTELGWIINVEKSKTTPSQVQEYLGVSWDTKKDVKFLSCTKTMKIKKSLKKTTRKGSWSWIEAKSLLGILGFASFVIPLGQVHCRPIQIAANRLNMSLPEQRRPIPKAAMNELVWWEMHIENRSRIFPVNPSAFMSTDASEWGWGANMNETAISKPWTSEQISWHINLKELFAVKAMINLNLDTLRERAVVVQSDNRTVLAYLKRQGGTKSKTLLKMTWDILSKCDHYDITLLPQYVPGKYNLIADSLSRNQPVPEWSLSETATQKIFARWGVPQIDLFASQASAVVRNYVSLDCRDKTALYINAFSQDWDYELAWIFPPPTLIPRVLQHLNNARGSFILIVPKWEKTFWRADLRKRAVEPPFQIRNLIHHLRDIETQAPPPNVKLLKLEAWKVNGSWGLPAFVCDIYIAMDVTSSTSSIFNLVAISVDRYIAVTQPIKYAKHKNNRRVWFTIVLVWLVSAAIGTPVVLGLNDTPDRNYGECLFNSQNYVIYSSLGSFYIPCIMMMFLYYSIFKALRIRAKKQRAAKKPPIPEGSQAVVIENVAQTRRLQETALDAATNTGSGSNEDDHDDSFDKRSVELEADADECHVIPNDKSTEFMLATVAEEPKAPKTLTSTPSAPDPNGNNDSGYAPSHVDEHAAHASPPGSPAPHAWRKNGKSAGLDTESRNASLALRSEDDQDATSQFGECKKERKASAATARFTIYKANKASKKKREKSSAKKERKATKTLAIVLGVFLFCWGPFFTCSVLDAVCGKLGLDYSPGVTVFILTTWLGYINSFLNPVIYTIFNPEFRKAFRKILHCGT